MSPKLTPTEIEKIRTMRKNHTQVQVAKFYGVSVTCVQSHCKDIIPDLKSSNLKIDTAKTHRTFVNECKLYKFSNLSEEDQKRYSECKPEPRGKETYTYVGF
jgi:ethanolamine ammonia-lyase small subunit